MFEPKREEVTETGRKLHNLYTSLYIIKAMTSGGLRWEGHIEWGNKK